LKKIFFVILAAIVLTGCGNNSELKGSGDKKQTSQYSSKDTSKSNAPSKIGKFKMTFARDNGVNFINSDLTGEKYLYSGNDNMISPDGSEVVYTQSGQDGSRVIAIYNIGSGTSKVLNSIDGKNSFDACFSPDGKMLVFCNFSGKKWNIGTVNTDDTGFKILSSSYGTDLFCPTFAPDGKSIICNGMNEFVEFDLDGKILQKISVQEQFNAKNIYLSSANRVFFINNKKELLFDADTEVFFETAREPISNIFVYNIESKSIRNISGDKISCYDPFVLSDGKNILFSAFTKEDLSKSTDPRDMEPVILSWVYTMGIDGKGKTKLIRNAYEPSASNVIQ